MADDNSEEKSQGALSDVIKKLFTVGMSAAFMTEESIRGYLAEAKLPKEVLSAILATASKSKEELNRRMANEFAKIISKVDFVKEASRFLEMHKIKVTAEVEFTKKTENQPTSPS